MSWLPLEIWLQIFKKMGPCTLLRAATVCRQWRALGHDAACWRRHWERVCATISSVDTIYEALVASCHRQHRTLCLWRSYRKLFLSEPATKKYVCVRQRLKVLSLLSLPPRTSVCIEENQPSALSVWSHRIVVHGMLEMVMHRHAEGGMICAPYCDVSHGYKLTHIPIWKLQWSNWNRFYTLTRDSDAEVVPETRPWVIIEANNL